MQGRKKALNGSYERETSQHVTFQVTTIVVKLTPPFKLTKYQAILGRQCEKAIWLDQFYPELKEPASPAELFRFAQGNAIDQEARRHFPAGVEIAGDDWAEALAETRKHIDAGASRLYQAAFEQNNLRIRTDVLDLLPDGSCRLREIKMSTSPKDYHLLDIATQCYVLEAYGLPVKEALLVHVNKEYVAGGDASFFIEVDLTENARTVAAGMKDQMDTYSTVMDRDVPPDILIGSHCNKPWSCPFKPHCWKDIPKDSIFTIPRLHETKRELLMRQGIVSVQDVPDDFKLTDNQAAYVRSQKLKEDKTNGAAITKALEKLTYPLYFLDFETYSPTLPEWAGVRVNQQVPFQFSCHRLDATGNLAHYEYLHTEFNDPRRAVGEALTRCIEDEGSILVYYQAFEERVLTELAACLPEFASTLNGMISRLFDQYEVVKNHVHHPDMLGLNSLKTVSEVLLDDIDYKSLDITEGATAQAEWFNLFQLPEAQRPARFEALRAYCTMDTMAQVALHRWFNVQG